MTPKSANGEVHLTKSVGHGNSAWEHPGLQSLQNRQRVFCKGGEDRHSGTCKGEPQPRQPPGRPVETARGRSPPVCLLCPGVERGTPSAAGEGGSRACGAELKFNGAWSRTRSEAPPDVASGMAARRLLLALAVTLGLQCNTKALSLSQKNATPVVSNLRGEESEFYDHQGRHCRMCPPGYSVAHHCEISGTTSTCKPCSNDSFSTHLNSFHECVPCKICRSLDQVMLKSCSKTSNTECACKEGTFCSPSQPCETCHKCKPRCPDGEEMAQPCTPQSDIECVPIPTSSPTVPSGKNDSKTLTPLWVGIFGGILVLCIVVAIYKYRKNLRCCFRDYATRTRANSIRSKTKCAHGPTESEDNEWNAGKDLLSQSQPGPSTRQPDETNPLREEECPVPLEEERRKLVPSDGKDPADTLCLSFCTIVEEVPLNKWHSYMMVLGLTYNEIDIAKANAHGSVTEQHFQMLRTWQEKNGKNASLDTLLKTLCDPNVNLKGVEIKIRETLISRHLYVYEE
uniref:tumor necrosis factor receptor superfamily member 10B-like n=1 Tax=Euleptes europaea TaxID=460621 RepID=UPI002540F257|nr:tumor necrosis factor receptor superfamily member 10B-like [Euleptes europaea]